MHLISGKTVSDVVLKGFEKILDEGHYRSSRNGGCTSVFDVTFEMDNPRSRHLHLVGRKSNIFAMIAETFWVMAGDDRVGPYLEFFLPRAPQYSDDGETWHGAYGPRFYRYGQHIDAFNSFVTDGLQTRRSFITISMPEDDSMVAVQSAYGEGHKPKDIPCNREIHFYVESDNKFCAKTIQRSGDMIFGTGSINPFEFSFLHELMFNEVKKIHPELELGPYRWHVTNAHLYDFSKEQAENALAEAGNYTTVLNENHMPLIGPDITVWDAFFADLVMDYTEAITTDHPEEVCNVLTSHLGHTFNAFNVPLENNLLWGYAVLVANYIASKRGVDLGTMGLQWFSDEVKLAIYESNFRKFNVVD